MHVTEGWTREVRRPCKFIAHEWYHDLSHTGCIHAPDPGNISSTRCTCSGTSIPRCWNAVVHGQIDPDCISETTELECTLPFAIESRNQDYRGHEDTCCSRRLVNLVVYLSEIVTRR